MVNRCTERLYNGVVKENPTFVQMLGMCPTLAVTTSAVNGIGMGLTTTVILVMSNLMISLLRKLIPDRVRIPAFIIVIASFVTIVQFLLEGFIPSLYDSLGIFIPLIVVNCIILGRAEAYASKNPVLPSVFDGLGMGLGFTVGLTAIGSFRELLGNGTIFNFRIMPGAYQPITIFILAPGAFFVLAFLIAAQNKIAAKKAAKAGEAYVICRDEDCRHCGNTMCGGRFFDFVAKEGVSADAGQGTVEQAASNVEEEPSQAKTGDTASEEKTETKENKENQGTGAGIGGEVPEQKPEDVQQEQKTSEVHREAESQTKEPGEIEEAVPDTQEEEGKQPEPDTQDGETQQLKPDTQEEEGEQPEPDTQDGETQQLKPDTQDGEEEQPEPNTGDGETQQLKPDTQDGEEEQPEPNTGDGETQQLKPDTQEDEGKQLKPDTSDEDKEEAEQ